MTPCSFQVLYCGAVQYACSMVHLCESNYSTLRVHTQAASGHCSTQLARYDKNTVISSGLRYYCFAEGEPITWYWQVAHRLNSCCRKKAPARVEKVTGRATRNDTKANYQAIMPASGMNHPLIVTQSDSTKTPAAFRVGGSLSMMLFFQPFRLFRRNHLPQGVARIRSLSPHPPSPTKGIFSKFSGFFRISSSKGIDK